MEDRSAEIRRSASYSWGGSFVLASRDCEYLIAENERLWRAVRAYRVNSIYESIDSMQELDEALAALAPIQEKP
jgi:hypothetical protein